MNKLIGVLATVALTAVAVGQSREPQKPEVGEGEPKASAVLAKLNARLPDVVFDGAPLEQVMEWVAECSGVNVWVRWQVLDAHGISRDKPISVKARNLRLSQVLWIILTEAGGPDVRLAYGTAENLLLVSTHADLSEELILQVYDVRDLLMHLPRFGNAPRVNVSQAVGQPGSPGGGAIVEPPQPPPPPVDPDGEMQRLVELVVNTIEPESWASQGGRGTIHGWRGRLIVRNSIYVHQLLGGTLQDIGAR